MKKHLMALALGAAVAWTGFEAALHWLPAALPLEVQRQTGRSPLSNFYRESERVFAPHPEQGYRYQPGLDRLLEGHPDFSYRLRTNGNGFRDDLQPGAPACAVALGDSFTFGYGVDAEDAWPEILEARWRCPVVNLGVSSWGSERMRRSLLDPGWSYEPKLVIWAYFMNDPWNASEFRAWRASEDGDMRAWVARSRRPERSQTILGRLDRSLSRHVLSYEISKWALGVGPYAGVVLDELTRRVGANDLTLSFHWLRQWIQVDDPDYAAGLEVTRAALRATQAEVRARDAKLVVLLVPPKELVYWHLLAGADLGFTQRDLLRPYADMQELCADLELHCIDLGPAMRERAQRDEQLFFNYDAHPNAAGNQLIADVVGRAVRP